VSILHGIDIAIAVCYFVILGLIAANSYLFIYKMKEYRRFHSVLFYALSFTLVIFRLVDLFALYKIYGIYGGPPPYSKKLETPILFANVSFFSAVCA
jgi:hypothetical protein